jgi:hypothetical protein
LEIDFADNRDDLRLYTPPFSHRRVRDGRFEFGSLLSFPHSWATLGKHRPSTFTLAFSATFALVHPDKEDGYIGVGVRNQNYYAGFGHIVDLNRDGSIVMCQPTEAGDGYANVQLRRPQAVDIDANHSFGVTFSESTLTVRVDHCSTAFPVADMSKVLAQDSLDFNRTFAGWEYRESL